MAITIVVNGTPREVAVSLDRKSTRLNSSHLGISYAVFCLKKKRNFLLGLLHLVEIDLAHLDGVPFLYRLHLLAKVHPSTDCGSFFNQWRPQRSLHFSLADGLRL